MYKAGHDSLGEEMMGILTDKENVSRKLLRVAMLRLGKHLSLIGKSILSRGQSAMRQLNLCFFQP